MLVLSRKPGEKILIGEDVTVTIVRIGPNTVRIGIEAPRTMNIVREELCETAGHCERTVEINTEEELT
jgi:carbon storage regulator